MTSKEILSAIRRHCEEAELAERELRIGKPEHRTAYLAGFYRQTLKAIRDELDMAAEEDE